MATIKSYTDLEQSKKLAEILPLESADMSWILVNYGDEAGSKHEPSLATYKTGSFFRDRIFPKDHTIPCWSLAVLLGVLPDYTLKSNEFYGKVALWCQGISVEYDNPLDACVAMVEKLHKLNLL